MKYVLGLTGPTGAGKSLISSYLEKKGAYIIDADKLSREITKENGVALPEITKSFPGVVNDGFLDRKALGKIVFADGEKLKILNEITHKYIKKLTEDMINSHDGLIVLDAPLLYEANEDELCDKVMFVTAKDSIRIERIMERDNLSKEDAEMRIKARELDEIMKKADVVIENDGDFERTKKEVDDYIKSILERD